MPGTLANSSMCINLWTTSWSRHHLYPHFLDAKTEVQLYNLSKIIQQVAEALGSEVKPCGSEAKCCLQVKHGQLLPGVSHVYLAPAKDLWYLGMPLITCLGNQPGEQSWLAETELGECYKRRADSFSTLRLPQGLRWSSIWVVNSRSVCSRKHAEVVSPSSASFMTLDCMVAGTQDKGPTSDSTSFVSLR